MPEIQITSPKNSKEQVKKILTKSVEECDTESWNDFLLWVKENRKELQSEIDNSLYSIKPEVLKLVKNHITFFENAGAVSKVDFSQHSECMSVKFEVLNSPLIFDKRGISELAHIIDNVSDFIMFSRIDKQAIEIQYTIANAITKRKR